MFRPQFTVQNILGASNDGAAQIAQELGFANLTFGVLGILGTSYPGGQYRRPSPADSSWASQASVTCPRSIRT